MTLKGSDMWRYVLSGLLSIGGVVLAFVASFGNPTTVLLDLPSAFQAPVIQAAVSPLASIRSPPATTLTPPPDQVSTKPPQAGPDAEKEARRLRQPPSFGDAERVVSVQPAQDNGEQIVAGEADSQAGGAALQAHVASMPPAASVIMLSEKSEAVASTSAPRPAASRDSPGAGPQDASNDVPWIPTGVRTSLMRRSWPRSSMARPRRHPC